jgi:hypothetical protein
MFVVIGLVAQFGTSLLSFLEKKQKKVIQAEEQTKLMDRPAEKVSWKKRSALAICVSVFFML